MILSPERMDNDLNIYGSNQNLAGKSNCSTSTTTTKSIDDVWNDISLSSFHHHHTTAAATTTTTNNHPPPFQDFFSSPITTNPCPGHSPRFTTPPAAAAASGGRRGSVISLNSAPIATKFLYKNKNSQISTSSSSCKCTEPTFFSLSKTQNFINGSAPSSSSSSSLRMIRPDPEYCEKHKRLMKNRESAARSRARKQARADELEIEVERLTKENAMLKRQLQQQLKLSNADPGQQQVPKRSRLNRTLTAPF